MSGLLPDLASWALRGQQPQQNGNDNNAGNEREETGNNDEQGPLTPEEMRAQRVQRMELLRQQRLEQQEQPNKNDPPADSANGTGNDGPKPMDVDTSETAQADGTSATKNPPQPTKEASLVAQAPAALSPSASNDVSSSIKKKRRAEKENEPGRKLHRKKELLLRKVLCIILSSTPGAATTIDASLVTMDIGSTDISVQTIAEVLSSRVSLGPSSFATEINGKPRKSLMAYLADCHRKAAEELKSIRSTNPAGNKLSAAQQQQQQQNAELTEFLQEIQKQVVSYGATILMEPDLFDLGNDSVAQLSDCLLASLTDLSSSITFGAGGNNASSFFFCLVEELVTQDKAVLERVVNEIVQSYKSALQKCDSVLDNTAVPTLRGGGGTGTTDNSPLTIVSALTALCMHKKVAEIVAQTSDFLLPPPESTQATETVRPRPNNNDTPPGGTGAGGANRLLQQFMANLAQQQPSYKKRSGPALEKSTLLGLCLRVGIPTKSNAAFSPASIMRQSFSALESATSQQRQQLRLYQESFNQFLHTLIKAGAKTRQTVLDWFTDALLVNVGASATRPDPSKISSTNLLLNMSVALLELSEPFVVDPAKHYLIDPHFCSDPSAHKGIYTLTGDDAVQRLAGSEDDDDSAMSVEFNPKNAFITQLFFLTARAIHFGIASSLSQHESLLRHLSHLHWHITNRGSNSDLQSDPQFALYVSRQRSVEVALFQEEMVTDHLRFLQVVAKFLCEMKDEDLANMPEDFVSDVCHVITSIAKLKPKLLRGIDVTYTFKQVVKLLSPTYASVRT